MVAKLKCVYNCNYVGIKMNHKKTSNLFKILRKLVFICYPKIKSQYIEKLPDEPMVFVANHCQLHGPVSCELYMTDNCYTWCAGEMMHLKDVPAYAYRDFWSQKPIYSRWFYKIASYIIAPLSVLIFNNARTIAVYHDSRILSTFRNTLSKLKDGNNIVIFPEHDVKHNHIIYDFQENFIDIAKLYYKNTSKELLFVPLYIAPKLKAMYFGKPIRYCASAPIEEERSRICSYLMSEITDMASGLPEHTVIPYRNIPKRLYPLNTSTEIFENEKTDC